MAGRPTTTHGRRERSGERRRLTPENRVIRRAVDVLGLAAEAPREREDDVRELLHRTRAETITTLRDTRPHPLISILERRVAPLRAALVIAAFLLGLGLGLSFGGTT